MNLAPPDSELSVQAGCDSKLAEQDFISGRESYLQANAYPEILQKFEQKALKERWAAAGLKCGEERKCVGLALSGGGIRSATFSLGVLQSLAKHRLLHQIDYLSTVSGGGYAGGFWGAWLNRLPLPAEATAAPPEERPLSNVDWLGGDLQGAQQKLADSGSEQVAWLRENGRYLSPNGAGDTWLAASVYQRNLVTLHLVLTPLFLTWFCTLAALSTIQGRGWLPAWLRWFGAQNEYRPARNIRIEFYGPIWGMAVGLLAVAAALGAVYWLIGWASGDVWRNRVTRYQAIVGITALSIFGIAMVDLVGASFYHTLFPPSAGSSVASAATAWGIGGLFAAMVSAGHWIKSALSKASSLEKKIPISAWIVIGATVLAFVWLVSLALCGYGIENEAGNAKWSLWMPPALFAVLSIALGRWTSLLNLSSLAGLYGARLTRAYMGASNIRRKDAPDITETIEGDQIDYASYFPHLRGGPLHLINVTINETLDPQSAIQRNDRKGVPMAIGPCGLSVGVNHHAEWVFADNQRTGVISALPRTGGSRFNVFAVKDGDRPRVEMLSLGTWIGISGAAFTTGLGAKTSLPLSFLLGFFNVRLGWWWDSGIRPGRRPGQGKRPATRWLQFFHDVIFQSQGYLLDEFTARFHGTARRDWYLSDGGHFENTAAYELIRRRVPLIIICDNGCDPHRTGSDFANLVRKVRVDFAADIRVIDPTVPGAIHKELIPLAGTLDELSATKRNGTLPAKCILFAKVAYAGCATKSLLVLIKPTITGDEAASVSTLT